MPFGRPASLQRSRNQLPNPAFANGLPKLVVRNVGVRLTTFEGGIAASAAQKSGCSGMMTSASSAPSFLCCESDGTVLDMLRPKLDYVPATGSGRKQQLDGDARHCPYRVLLPVLLDVAL